jgi:hypothetical protein
MTISSTPETPKIEPIPAEGLAWLHQSARVHGATYSQVLLHVLERIELLDKDSIEQSKSNSFCFEAVIKRLEKLEAAENLRQQGEDAEHAAPTPEAAPVATDEELWSLSANHPHSPNSAIAALRACYDLGRQHGAAQPSAPHPTPPAPEPVAPVSDSKMAAYNHRAAARFAILDRLEKSIDFTKFGWELTPQGEQWKKLMAEQGQDERETGL